jgi:hypothetical protein
MVRRWVGGLMLVLGFGEFLAVAVLVIPFWQGLPDWAGYIVMCGSALLALFLISYGTKFWVDGKAKPKSS